jgi:hypothetical protein
MTNEKQSGLILEKTGTFNCSLDAVPELLPGDKQKEKAIIEAKREVKEKEKENKESPLEADNKALQATDPQENMEGPISSIMQTIKEVGESNDVVSKKEADKKKDENT